MEIFKADGMWMVRYPGNREIIDLFGCDSLPTPFFDTMLAVDVETLLHVNHPGAHIEVVEA